MAFNFNLNGLPPSNVDPTIRSVSPVDQALDNNKSLGGNSPIENQTAAYSPLVINPSGVVAPWMANMPTNLPQTLNFPTGMQLNGRVISSQLPFSPLAGNLSHLPTNSSSTVTAPMMGNIGFPNSCNLPSSMMYPQIAPPHFVQPASTNSSMQYQFPQSLDQLKHTGNLSQQLPSNRMNMTPMTGIPMGNFQQPFYHSNLSNLQPQPSQAPTIGFKRPLSSTDNNPVIPEQEAKKRKVERQIQNPVLSMRNNFIHLNKKLQCKHLVSRPKLASRVIQTLQTQRGEKLRFNALVMGPHGCGKTMLASDVASTLFDYQQLDFSAMLHLEALDIIQTLDLSDKVHNQLIKKLEELFVQTDAANPGLRTLIWIEDVDALFKISSDNWLAAQVVRLLNKYPHIQLIFSTSPQNYQSRLSSHESLLSYFQTVSLETMDDTTTLQVLKEKYQGKADVAFLGTALHLANRYFPQEANPKKSIALVEESLAFVAMQTQNTALNGDVLSQVIASKTNIPLSEIQGEAHYSLADFEKRLGSSVVGQSHVIKTVAEDVLCFKGGWNNSQKPPMVYVFAGPTGVGKTELAKKIAEVAFGQAQKLVRLDMAEFYDRYALSRLVGAPPGYIGYDEGGQLTGALEKHGSCVVLLDEIEKAHPEVLKIFLALFDEGRISSAKGKEYNCKNVCFIMTTNLGADQMQESIRKTGRFEMEQTKQLVQSLISSKFGPEWLGRVKVLPFAPLTENVCQKVVNIHLQKLAEEFAQQRQIQFHWDQAVVDFLAKNGFNPALGARPLIGFIDKSLRLKMAQEDGMQKFQPGDKVYCQLNDEGQISITRN